MNKLVKNSAVALTVSMALVGGAAMAQTGGSYDVSDATAYITGLLAVIATVGVAWVSVSYLKKGWKALRGV